MRPWLRWFRFAATFLFVTSAPLAHAAERKDVDAKYRWDLTAMYASDADWAKAREAIQSRIPALANYSGHLGDSPAALERALDAIMGVRQDLDRLAGYASQRADEDERDGKPREMRDEAGNLRVTLGTTLAWLRPEILGLGSDKVHAFLAADPALAPYKPYLEDILRYAPHTLTPGEEAIEAQAGRMFGAGATIRGVLNDAEIPWPWITLSNGEKVRLDDAAYTEYRQSSVRADRDSVFRAFFREHTAFQGTYGAALSSLLETHVFTQQTRHYNSCMEEALFGDNIPPTVYTQLLDDVHASLPTLHRYLKLRQRMMGLSELRYEDLYAPIVKDVDLHYTPEQSMDIVLQAVAPLGQAYVDTLRKGFASRWIDWMPTTGKASGAYSTGAYGVHPYQLQNFTGLYDEVSTLAHESGHSMHTFLADHHQPYVTHDYATFVAEVASTLNENLLFHWMLDHTRDRATRLYLLGSQLENLRGTLFRQVMFAEFELAIHQRAEEGEAQSGQSFSKLYLDLVRRYYGHDLGVCKVDSLYAVEWSYIPHFYYDFYVYQYATSIVASTALANGIREEAAAHHGTEKRDAYLHMLESGSSRYPIDLLKSAGVDMTTSAPFQAAMKEMNSIMDEMEQLLARK